MPAEKGEKLMGLSGVSMSAMGVTGIETPNDLGVAMLSKSLDAEAAAAQGAISMINNAPVPSLDPNVGTRFDASV